jgi:hypothetical protein
MRFEELAYRVDGLAVTVPFHRTLTVVSGLGPALRRPWADRALGVLRGGPPATAGTLVFIDGSGSRVRLVRDGRGQATLTDLDTGENLLATLAEGSAVDFLTLLGLEPDDAAAIMLLGPTALERDPAADSEEAPPPSAEIAEAREVLARVQAEYDEVRAAHSRVAELRARQDELDHQIRNFDEELDRRRHGRAAHAVHRLEAELAQLTGTEPAERQAGEAAIAAAGVATRWQRAREDLTSGRIAFGERRRLDPRALAHALELPTETPAGLEALHTAYLAAAQHRTQLVARLNEGTDSELPAPSAPWVLSLARIEHPELWTRAEKLMAVKTRAAELSMGLGGTGQHRDLVGELEAAHQAVELAEREVASSRLGGMAAKRRLAKACEYEHAVLTKAGFVSWLAFQMRRIDVLLEPDALEALRVAELEAQLAAAAWSELAGDVDPAAALAARPEIERYAFELAANVSDIDATEALRKELGEIVEPAYFEARAELLDACGPFDVDLEHATSEVAAIVSEARHARLQATLETAETAYRQLEAELGAALTAAGFPGSGPGDLPTRVIAVKTKAAEVAAALETPKTTRDPAEVQADLAAARYELARWSRPDWDEDPLVTDAPLPDTASLTEERAAVAAEADGIERSVPDPGRLSDRREALARRVAILEANSGAGSRLLSFEEAEMVLLGRFAQARRVGPEAEPIPVVVDDALAGFPRHDKWRLLDLLARLGEASQVIYLTDDPDTAEWAAARARQGSASLLRPDAVASVA